MGEAMVPLIDVVFFLLVFALLIGRMDANTPFEVSPPLASATEDLPAGGATIAISIEGDLSLDGSASTQLDALTALTKRLQDDPDLRIRVQADRDADLRHLLPVLDALNTLGASEVVLVVTPDPDG